MPDDFRNELLLWYMKKVTGSQEMRQDNGIITTFHMTKSSRMVSWKWYLPSKQVGWERENPYHCNENCTPPNYTAAEPHANILLIRGESLIRVY